MSKSSQMYMQYQEELYYNEQMPHIEYSSAQTKVNVRSLITQMIKKASDWIKRNWFPVPISPLERRLQVQQDIEACSKLIYNEIEACNSMQHSYEIMDRIDNFRYVWGDKPQVIAAVDSLKLKLRNRMIEHIQSK